MFWSLPVSAGWPFAPRSVYAAFSAAAIEPPWLASSGLVGNEPEHPVADEPAWPCWSCTRMNVTMTRLQSIAPSSGSTTLTVYGIDSPQTKKSPSTGVLIVTTGLVLPAVIVMVLMSWLPAGSFTTSRAV